MPISLGNCLSKNGALLVSSHSLFGDKNLHVCTLVGLETGGLWLQINDPGFTLFQTDISRVPPTNPNVFVPFAQIGYLLDSTTMANSKGAPGQPASATNSPSPPGKPQPKPKKSS
jgi:hypothetical protein